MLITNNNITVKKMKIKYEHAWQSNIKHFSHFISFHPLGWNRYQQPVSNTSKFTNRAPVKKFIFLNILKTVCIICSPQRKLVIFLYQPLRMVKHIQTIRRKQPANCLSMSHHFVGLELKVLGWNVSHIAPRNDH